MENLGLKLLPHKYHIINLEEQVAEAVVTDRWLFSPTEYVLFDTAPTYVLVN